MRKGLYILFEGSIITGKTTHAKNLAKLLNELNLETYYRRSIPSSTKRGELIKSLRKHSTPKLFDDFLYVFDAFLDYIWIRIIRSKGYNIVQDKFTPSLRAFIKSHRNGFNQKVIVNMLNYMEKYFLEPDLVFYLTTQYDEKIKRVSSKHDLTNYDYSLISNRKILDKVENELEKGLKKYKNIERIDTTRKEIEEVDKIILEKTLKTKLR
jgi:thymidylate kinase